jgi:hypothetical protein
MGATARPVSIIHPAAPSERIESSRPRAIARVVPPAQRAEMGGLHLAGLLVNVAGFGAIGWNVDCRVVAAGAKNTDC